LQIFHFLLKLLALLKGKTGLKPGNGYILLKLKVKVKKMIQALITLIHILVCIALIVIVLLQKGKGASIGSVFGGSSQTLFGATGGTTFMHKITVASAIIFMFTCLMLAFMFNRAPTKSIMSGVGNQPVQSTQPASPAAPPANVPAPPAENPTPAPSK
jgi:preprotein translocase subunit SecG